MTINNKNYKVDGFCKETNAVYEFFGCFWHGCPKCYKPNVVNSNNQKDMGTLNDQTIEKRETIKMAGYRYVSTYECQLAKDKNSLKISHRKSSNHLIQVTLFTEEELMLPSSYTISKKTSMAVTSMFGHSIQLSNSTKNTQLVIPPKYSSPKSRTNLGTVLLSAKSFHLKDSIIRYYQNASK